VPEARQRKNNNILTCPRLTWCGRKCLHVCEGFIPSDCYLQQIDDYTP
jgi:hypothetical protein